MGALCEEDEGSGGHQQCWQGRGQQQTEARGGRGLQEGGVEGGEEGPVHAARGEHPQQGALRGIRAGPEVHQRCQGQVVHLWGEKLITNKKTNSRH